MILAQVSPGATITTDLTLTADLDASSYAGTALIVGANNITIDGAGYTITVNGNNFAFDLSSRSGVTIQNVTVVGTASQQGRGVLLGNTNTAVIQNNTFSGLYDGLFAQGTNSTCTITGNDMSGSGTGFSSQTYVNNVQFTVTDNNMTNCTGWAMAYQGTPAEINGNDFSGSASGLILLNAVRSAGNEFVMTWQGEASGPNKNTFGDHTALLMQLHGSQFLDITGWDFASLYAAGTNLTQKQGIYLGNTPKKAHSECWIGAGASGPIPIPGTGDQHLGL